MKKCLPAAFSILFYLGAQAQFTKIFDFDSIPSGSAPVGHLASDGTYFYGTTYAGGANGLGVIYKIKPDGTGYVKLSDFNGAGNGSHPGIDSGPFFDGTYLYGTTIDGGTYNDGVIYRIRPDGTGDTVLYHFDGTLGKTIYCTLISDGTYLYGVASKGGLNTYGSIFKIKPDGTAMTKIFDFAGISNGSNTSASLIYDGTYLYGVTAGGGTGTGCVQGCGVLYKIKTDGSSFSTLINFSKNPDGDDLESQLVFDGTFLYGQTQDGGANNVGTLFKIKTDGTSYTKLYDFSPISGQTPTGLVSDGTYLYGTTYQNGGGSGTLYRIKPDGTGFLKLRAFGPSDGGYPLCNLVYDAPYIYGSTTDYGAHSNGTLYKYSVVTGITEAENEMSLSIYPNPSTGKFNIAKKDNGSLNGEICVYNLLGETVHKQSGRIDNEIDLSGFPKGIYFVKYTEDAHVYESKLVID